MSKPLNLHEVVSLLNLDADAVSAPPCSGEAGRPRSAEGIEDGVTGERKHPHEPLRQFEWIGSEVLSDRGPFSVPDLAEPLFLIFVD